MEIAEREPLQLILISMELPGMTAWEVIQHVREHLRWSQAGIVLMTSNRLAPDSAKLLRRFPCVEVIIKPFSPEKLQEVIGLVGNNKESHCEPIAGSEAMAVLVVDDSSLARHRCIRVLSGLGFQRFVEAEDGDEAIAILQRQRFDLVVTDFNMPNVSGLEVVSYIRRQSSQRDVPVVMVTSEVDPIKLAEVYQAGVSAVCHKSFDPGLVQNIVTRLFLHGLPPE